MDDAALMRGGDAGAELPRDRDGAVFREAADATEQRGEILAVDVLHREEAAAVGLAKVVEAADVPVRDLAQEDKSWNLTSRG